MSLNQFVSSKVSKLDKLQLAMEIVQSALLVAEQLEQTHSDYYGTLLQKESVLNQKIAEALKNAVTENTTLTLCNNY